MRAPLVPMMWVSTLVAGCGLLDGGADFTISGRVAPRTTSTRTLDALASSDRAVTHVMAVDPETASPRRSLSAVDADGNFELSVESGHPYVIVFVDDTAIGADMVVALFRASTLDSISPQLAGHLVLGDVEVDAATQTATGGISYGALIESLGLSAGAAEYLGSVDDLSLRYANPDIDGDGVIDLEQDRHYALDFHVRSTMHRGSADGARFTVADMTDQFLPASGADIATPVFDLTSIYVLYPASFDATDYVSHAPPPAGLINGGAYSVALADGSAAAANTSFSGLGFGDTRGWGPDYDYTRTPGLELPGSGGTPATLAYTLGGVATTLTFTNVVTRTRASLTAAGSLAIFLRLVTRDGAIASLDYEWRKVAADASWIRSNGGYVSFHRAPAWSDESGISIPAEPSGSIAWDLDPLTPDGICGLAVSYDDKLGLRHFIGGADPNPGVTCTP